MRMQVTPTQKKALSVVWGSLDTVLITGHEDGSITKWDIRTGKKVIPILFLLESNDLISFFKVKV